MKILISLFFIGTTGIAAAQQLTLQHAVSTALKNSLEIELSRNTVALNKTNNYYGVAGGLPTVSATGSDVQQQSDIHQELNTGTAIDRKGANVNNASASVTAGILLYNGSRVIATKKRLSELQQQSETQLNAQVQNIIAAVMTAYYDVIRQQYFLKTISQSLEVARQKSGLVVAQQQAGMANNADLFQAQLDYNTLLQSQQNQQLIIAQSKTELLRLIQLNPDSLINIEDTILVAESFSLDQALAHIPANADILAAEHQVNIQRYAEREIAAQRYPSLNANTGYNFNRTRSEAGQMLLNQSNGPFIGVSLALPIYAGSSFKRRQQAAVYATKNAGLQKDILVRDYTAAMIKTYQAYASSLSQLKTQQHSLDTAQKLLDLIMLKFKLRQATIIDVKVAQQSFETVSYNLSNLAFTAKAAEIELKRLSNTLEL